jgi:hypothetical protein
VKTGIHKTNPAIESGLYSKLSEYSGLFLSTLADPFIYQQWFVGFPIRSGTTVGVCCDTNRFWANYKLPRLSSLRINEYHFRTASIHINYYQNPNNTYDALYNTPLLKTKVPKYIY